MGFFAALLPLLKGTVGKAIVSNVATSAISSLANRSQTRADRRQALGDQSEQFVRLRDAAEKAGFNPLTALRANPTGGMVNPTPALASGAFLRDALGAGVQTYFNRDQIIKDEERDLLERKLMRQELANMQLQGKAFEKSMQFGFGVGQPVANNYTGTDRPTGHTDTPVLSFGGVEGATASDTSDTQRISDRYGELIEMFYGAGVLARDLGKWARQKTDRWAMERETERRQWDIDNPFGDGKAYDTHKGRHRPGMFNLPPDRPKKNIQPFFDLSRDELPKFDLKY